MRNASANIFSKIFSVFTALVLLNMSMVMSEVAALQLNKNRVLLENIMKQLAGASSEEETDCGQGMADEDISVKEIDLLFVMHVPLPPQLHSISERSLHVSNQGIPRLGNYEIYSPPPEV